jgi:hypothetical protein
MSDSAAGITASQILPTELGQARPKAPGEAGEGAADNAFASVLPQHMQELQEDTASIMLPPGLFQALDLTGKVLPPVAIGSSQFLPAGKTNGKSEGISGLGLDGSGRGGKGREVSLLDARREVNAANAGATSRAGTAVEQARFNFKAELEATGIVKFSADPEGIEAGIKLGSEQISTAVNDRQSAQYALSQSVVTSRETGEGGISKAEIHLGPRFNHQDWGNAMAARVNWQAGEKIQIAQFSINPPDLGPVEVKISLDNDKASVQFHVMNGAVKEALEDALPRLRELMSQSGMTLADSNVSQQSRDQGGQSSSADEALQAGQNPGGEEIEGVMLNTMVRIPQGLVDDYI